ncbi:MAG: late competence development ComFB family protein [Gammaproteobacteria bacterium]|nr:late competence development ComFB family protein [Gammaproteobacteria bacterium]
MILNYQEDLVKQALQEMISSLDLSLAIDSIEDISCLALNRLPARYIRHRVDNTFYMTIGEQQRLQQAARRAVLEAWQFINQPGSRKPESQT